MTIAEKNIDMMPKKAPSLDEMIDTCAKVGTESFNMGSLADSFAAALKLTHQCHGFGHPGHIRENCPPKQNSLGTHQKQRLVSMVENCNRCGRSGHSAKQCKSKFHANGQFLGKQGNCSKSTTHREDKRGSWHGCFHC